jgi:DNA-binding MarR family transcriptional regulator
VPTRSDVHAVAGDLRVVVSRLVRRFRADGPLPTPQIGALASLVRQGPRTTSQLAALERVRPQSMAHTVAELEAAGLVERRPDLDDQRQTLIDLTDAGRATMDEFRRAGEGWIAQAITAELDDEEQAALARGVELLRRLVEA